MAEAADLLMDLHDLPVDRVGVAGAQDAAGDRLLGGDADQRVGRPAPRAPHCATGRSPDVRRQMRRVAAGQEFRHLRSLLQAGVEEPQQLAADRDALRVGVADIAQRGIGETVGAGRRQPRFLPCLAIGIEGALRSLRPAQHQRVDIAAPPQLGRGLGIAGRRPELRVRPLIRPGPEVDVPVGVVLALEADRPVMRGQRQFDDVDRLPEAVDEADRVGVARHHLAVARFDEADFEAAARDHIGGGVFLGDAHRVRAHRNQRAERQDADVLGLAGGDAEHHRARAIEAVDAGMMLDRLVAQQMLVEAFLEQIGGNLRVAIFVRQAGAHRLGAVEHVLRHEGVDVFAMVPGLHVGSPARHRWRVYKRLDRRVGRAKRNPPLPRHVGGLRYA